MATWGRLASALRGAVRSPRSLRSPALRRAVGPGLFGCAVGTGLVLYYRQRADRRTLPFSVLAEEQKEPAAPQLSARRIRFNQFASVVYQEEPYMTPRDFLFSVMLEDVDRKLQKRILTQQVCLLLITFDVTSSHHVVIMSSSLCLQEVDRMLVSASKVGAGNDLFRTLGDNGLISYTEYLFLLTILTKPRTGFHIAFKMLDVDGNEQVDQKEFLKLKNIIGSSKKRIPVDGTEPHWCRVLFACSASIFTECLQKPAEEGERVNTTLQAYFFGKKGDNKLQYQEFRRFMENLQSEVQEMEFMQFSKGMDTMRREDFAEWLLHYTNAEDNDIYWENMRKKIPAGQSITFDEFKAFCLFTNNLEDFSFSMKLVIGANRPVGMAQFKRAVRIATGHDLSENVLDTVFKLFDMDGDNCLSHKEFIDVMKDRVLRGLRVQHQAGFSGYWKCVKRETLKGAQEALGDGRCPI
ncbi:Calcium uptake protein 2, mitochondrial EF-hand domain-containing family member A1 [Collichthys lucidus]|uniref:Calcium uptake protein 2, mitochondrial EF-hand domain-containing family member A1 n=1 Tax=Collichthys lucidus TaxID=240159 RepID=A0A4U5V7M3_COLLU|nr:Calcium uptake protein 2, mitochondrial EF-hand domain-containing family member A1 [Collichthys lucidus]